MWKSACISRLAVFGLAYSVAASPMVYEGFDYPTGVLAGNSGGTGLTGAWSSHPTTATVGSPGLTYGSLPVSGNKMRMTGANNHFGGARDINAAALSGNGLLDNGATLWFSALVGYAGDGNATNTRLGLALANDSFNEGNYNYWINDDGGQTGQGLGVKFGRNNGTNHTIAPVLYRDLASGDAESGNITGTVQATGMLGFIQEFGLVVGRYSWGASTDTLDIWWVDTGLSIDTTTPDATLVTDVDQALFDTLTFTRSEATVLDEIRFGANKSDVGVVPEPSTFGLVLVGLWTVTRLRRLTAA